MHAKRPEIDLHGQDPIPCCPSSIFEPKRLRTIVWVYKGLCLEGGGRGGGGDRGIREGRE